MNQDRNNFRVATTLENRFSGQAFPYHIQALSQKLLYEAAYGRDKAIPA
jgi:hypothetical protein